MKTRFWMLFALPLALLAVAASAPPADPDACMRAGDAAYQRGDLAAAATQYERAGERSTEPGRVAFNLATVKVRLALEADADRDRLLRESEQLFRCCLDRHDPRRPRALYGLGNCLLLQSEGRDAAGLAEAAARYQECLADPDADAALAADARHNLERARLLLLQLTPPTTRPSEDDASSGNDTKPKPPPSQSPGTQQQPAPDHAGGKGKPDATGDPVKPQEGPKPVETDEPPPPGPGHLPPVPDRADLPPLSAQDAAAHLDQAAKQILEEARAHRKTRVQPPPAGVRDW